jgi:hypothetical protein
MTHTVRKYKGYDMVHRSGGWGMNYRSDATRTIGIYTPSGTLIVNKAGNPRLFAEYDGAEKAIDRIIAESKSF